MTYWLVRDFHGLAVPSVVKSTVKYSLITFGCRVNQADSLAIESALCARGAEPVSSDRADLVIVNTCSVTAAADQGARQTIRRIARENPSARIVATGCYATRCADDVAALPGVVEVVANTAKDAPGFVARFMTRDGRAVEIGEGHCGLPLAPGLMGRTAWTLRVQTGCDEACSYCIIPTTRGASRSRPLIDVAREVERVAAAGYKEIVITGVHLGSYGRDLDPRASLSELLGRLIEAGHRVLFRISSLEPMDCTPAVIEQIATATVADGDLHRSIVAPHFHLPLQHASNRILSVMRRPYSIEFYSALVNDIRNRLPHAAIGSDVIAGFPGETDEDFEECTTYLESSPLTHLHVFPYSERPGTEASSLVNKVHGSVIKLRSQRLREISRRLAERFRTSLQGTVRPALTIEDGSVSVTDNYFRIPSPPGVGRNEWVKVTL